MKRKFVTNLVLLLFLNILVKPFWMFGIDRTVQNTVGAREYGLYFSLFSLSILLNILLDAGITNYNNRSIARDPSVLKKHLSRIIPLKFSLAFFYAIIVFAAGFFLGYSNRQFGILSILALNQFLLSFILYLRSNISGLHFFRTDSLISVLDRFIMIVICGILLWGNVTNQSFQIEWFVYAQTASYLMTMVTAFLIVFSKSGKLKLRFNFRYGLSILRHSYPYAILILLMSFFNRIDSVMIESLISQGKVQAGIYAQGFRILDASAMFAFLFAGLLLPIFSRMIKTNEPVGDMIKLSYSLLMVPAISLIVLSFNYNKEIIGLLYHEHIEYSSEVYQILIFGFLFISSTYIFGTLLTANGNLKQLNILAGITVILNVSLNLILIPGYGAKGAAWASITSQGFFAIAQMLLSKIIFRLPWNSSFIIRLVLFVIVFSCTAFLVEKSGMNWIHGFFLLILLALAEAWILKIISPSYIYRILKYEET